MKERGFGERLLSYRAYLLFILAACGGACVWQLFFPRIAGPYSAWGIAEGWQREIALWNAALITAAALAMRGKDAAVPQVLTIQATVLCWLLGVNHLAAFLSAGLTLWSVHFLGVLEVLLVGGIWGTAVLIRERKRGARARREREEGATATEDP